MSDDNLSFYLTQNSQGQAQNVANTTQLRNGWLGAGYAISSTRPAYSIEHEIAALRALIDSAVSQLSNTYWATNGKTFVDNEIVAIRFNVDNFRLK